MQRSGVTPTTQNTVPHFSSSSYYAGNITNASNANTTSSPSKSRPRTNSGDRDATTGRTSTETTPRQPNVLHKDRDRRPSFSLKQPLFGSPSRGKRRANSISSPANNGPGGALRIVTDNTAPPALPDFALADAAKVSRDTDALQSPSSADSFSRMLSRTAPTPVNGYAANSQLAPPAVVTSAQPSESSLVHQHIQEIANKRISTLDYLRKA